MGPTPQIPPSTVYLTTPHTCPQVSHALLPPRPRVSPPNRIHLLPHTAAAASSPMVTRDAAVAGRYLAVLRPPSDHHHPPAPAFELDESDVVWSSSSPADDQPPSPASPPPASHFRPDRPGISAALSDDRRPLVRRKPSLDPSVAASAAHAIPPVPVLRSGWSGSASSGVSAPVNVPVWPKARSSGRLGIWDEDEDEEESGDGDGEGEVMLPPHEIVARTHKGTTFSVFEGVGRTLKGRDLRWVRDAVFQKTGFLE